MIKNHLTYKRDLLESTRAQLSSLTFEATRSIDAITRNVTGNVNSVAEKLSAGELTHKAAMTRLRELLEQNPYFYGSTITYQPFAFDPGRRLYSAYYIKKNGKIEYIRLDTIYDYTKPEFDWFGDAISKGPLWTRPYYDEAARTLMVTYSAPFHGKSGANGQSRVMGVVTIDISMESIRQIIESLDLGPTGFGALVSQKGVYLYHPDTELVISHKTLAQASQEQNDRDRLFLAGQAAKRGAGILDHHSKTTGLDSWLIYAPVPSTGWSLQNTFIKDDLPWDINLMRRQLIGITCALVIFISSTITLLFRASGGGRPHMWAASLAIAILLMVAIGYLWKISLAYDSFSGSEDIRISDKTTLLHVTNSFTNKSASRHTEPPVYIPTGLFIESAALNISGDLSLSGYLWQKYRLGAQDSIPRGFTISGASSLEADENNRIRENGFEVVRWYFRCVLPQRIDHSKYPLEQVKLSLKILHKDLNHNVFLVPDLASYKLVTPSSLPGLRKALTLPGWTIERSFFELRKNNYDTNFGLERPLTKENFPSFCFSIMIKRIFIDAFISNLTALIIVTILLFTLLMITNRDERLVSFMQAGCGRILSICTAMFFVIAFSHVDIRRKIAAEQIFYLEYFYFLIYFAILLIAINSVLYSMGAKIKLIQHQENLLPKLLFWPFMFCLLFIITVVTFY